ncbi:MAG: GTP 3',8-cyclase MoaA [Candidatus Nezhaarchaeales archaeon]|nr:MAG: GTP 3',8-cyclase MoaA [Candidatus Nezhaarchaeota archaeon WYZ-LMO8]TDA37293.1 MAG: GTP 3',8-cyclase MoaA [Candidatus Nezhaarchaeota archaeon WYZ-LMO7]
MLYDKYGRPITSLRITVTHRCNYRCFYCHMEGEEGEEVLTIDDIMRLVKIGKKLEIDKVKLTGGEPLIRHDIVDIVKAISDVKVADLAMTTNGSLLEGLVAKLVESGLKRINVSLPSLKSEVFEKITGVKMLDKVISGILKSKDYNLKPIKLNMVLLKGLNNDEVWEMIDFARKHDLILQIIELEPLGISNELYREYHMPLNDIEKWLEERSVKIEERKSMHKRKQYDLGDVRVELVRAVDNPEFCMHCTRLRVTADGKLKPCLMRNDNLIDVLRALRKRASDEELIELFIRAINAREPYFKNSCRVERASVRAKIC